MTRTPQQRIERLKARLAAAVNRRNRWKTRARTAEQQLRSSIILPGEHVWKPDVERWRSLVHHHMTRYGNGAYLAQPGRLLDLMLGIMQHESGGDPLAICRVEWVGTPPPGYDATPATRASGLFQHVPAYFDARARAAGYTGRSTFDPEANVATACWLLWNGWHPETAPNWQHWSAAHLGRDGSYEWAVRQIRETP